MSSVKIAVVMGGVSAERDVSLVSGEAVYSVLKNIYPTELIDLKESSLPSSLLGEEYIVFSTLHGQFGEDGAFQSLLKNAGIEFTGCDVDSSALCMNKPLTKERASSKGINVIPGIGFTAQEPPSVRDVLNLVGSDVVIKPADEGSSVGLVFAKGESEIQSALDGFTVGNWMLEKRIYGREFTVGVLEGKAMGIVEICPRSGVYDFNSKYTAGSTDYIYPAELAEDIAKKIQKDAESLFLVCGCRDYARIDFMLTDDDCHWLLEVNTLPGLTPTSLFPKSASCMGFDFEETVVKMVEPAIKRHIACKS